jgi:hypothetical protein
MPRRLRTMRFSASPCALDETLSRFPPDFGKKRRRLQDETFRALGSNSSVAVFRRHAWIMGIRKSTWTLNSVLVEVGQARGSAL